MKLSLYNWIVEYKEDIIAYNGFTGAMALLNPENVDAIKSLFDQEENIDSQLDSIGEKLQEGLLHGGFVIDEELDERKLLKISFDAQRFRVTSMDTMDAITLVMTRACNFRCGYCFESELLENGDMITNEVLDRIVQIAGESSSKIFSLHLYGGEPLLLADECIDVTGRCKEAVAHREGIFRCSIITNGYLLTPEIARDLKDNGCDHAQITIDGSRETHNRNRPLANGGGTYDRILKNVKECAEHLNIKIRMNTMGDNPDEADELRRIFAGYPSVAIDLAPINLSCKGDTSFVGEVQTKLANAISADKMKLRHIYARPGGCSATEYLPSVVLPDGSLARCWELIGKEDKSGNIFDDPIRENDVEFARWVGWNPYQPGSGCYDCRFLPVCGGGCPRADIKDNVKRCLYFSQLEYEKSIIGSYISLNSMRERQSTNGEPERS